MNAKILAIISKLMVHVALIFALSASLLVAEPAKASNGHRPTNFRTEIQSATFIIDETERYISLTVTRDEIANTTLLSFGYRFPDPNDPTQSIYVLGDEGEIPNSTFAITATSAQLLVTTPDSYPVTRCVVNNETGDFTCAPTSPSTFDLTWTADGSWMLHEATTQVQTIGDVNTRFRGVFDEVAAIASGTWDEHSGTTTTGYLVQSKNSTLLQEVMREAGSPLFSLITLQAGLETVQTSRAKGHFREAFSFLESADGGGVVRVWQDEITNTTYLRFSYSYRDPTDLSSIVYMGLDEIPSSAFNITASSARLSVTTPESYFVLRCVVTGVIGEPGAFTCAPSTTPVTFDVTWNKDGYESLHETGTRVHTVGSITTRYHRLFSRITAPASGSWRESIEHTGTNMTAYLFNIKETTIDHTNP